MHDVRSGSVSAGQHGAECDGADQYDLAAWGSCRVDVVVRLRRRLQPRDFPGFDFGYTHGFRAPGKRSYELGAGVVAPVTLTSKAMFSSAMTVGRMALVRASVCPSRDRQRPYARYSDPHVIDRSRTRVAYSLFRALAWDDPVCNGVNDGGIPP